MSDKAIIFDSRRACLIASVGDSKRRVFAAAHNQEAFADCPVRWGLATTEHEFRKALSEHTWKVSRLTRDDLQAAMAEELTGGEK